MLNMKRFLIFFLLVTTAIFVLQGCEEDKSKRVSPPATTSETTTNGNTITINYSRPSLKGRTIGKDIVPFDKVWRAGANEATTFEMTKDAKIEGKALPRGKYSLYTIPGGKTWTIIFNKTWEQWGTEYKEADDALRVQVTSRKAPEFVERLRFVIEKDGTVLLFWGDTVVAFKVD
ncbi:MAG: hypothetical protein JWQ09_5361 [Segetibacter sp.]|nr:hypothetical protein [Segetibacter sp.]